MPYCYNINIQNTYIRYSFFYFSTKIRMCVGSIFYYIDSANKRLVQGIVILVFHPGVYIINRKLHGRLEIRHLSSRVEDKCRMSARPYNILHFSTLRFSNKQECPADLHGKSSQYIQGTGTLIHEEPLQSLQSFRFPYTMGRK